MAEHHTSEALDAICSRLESIGEEITDLAMEGLRDAIADGEGVAPVDEKRLARARRAVEKAIFELRGPTEQW